MKKTNYLITFTFLLLSLSIWATEIPNNSNNNLFVANTETVFIQENTVSNFNINDILGKIAITFDANIPKKSIDSKQFKDTLTTLQISNCNLDESYPCLHFKSNTITTGLEHFFVADSKQTEKHFTSNQFYNIQGSFFISEGTIFYIEHNQNIVHQKEFAQNYPSKNSVLETIIISKQKHSNPTITKTLPISGNSFYRQCATKLATLPILNFKNKKSNALSILKNQKAFLDFNNQKNLFLAIVNESVIQPNFCKYCFSLPPPIQNI